MSQFNPGKVDVSPQQELRKSGRGGGGGALGGSGASVGDAVGDALGQPAEYRSHTMPTHCVVARPTESPSTTMLAVLVVVPTHIGQSRGLYVALPSSEYMIEPAHALILGHDTLTPRSEA